MRFKSTAGDGERGGWGSSGVRWKTVPQTSGCDRKRSVADSGQTSTYVELIGPCNASERTSVYRPRVNSTDEVMREDVTGRQLQSMHSAVSAAIMRAK